MEKFNTCCFFGHREISVNDKLEKNLYESIERLITDKGVNTFLFGSKSQFNSLCLEMVTMLKEKYPDIKRTYVRAEFAEINDDYEEYLLTSYDSTYYPEKILNAGKAVYVERNYEMIDKSEYCIFYLDENYTPPKRRSGTKIAYEYAVKKNKKIEIIL